MAEQNATNFNSADFTIASGVFDLNDAVVKTIASDSGSVTPSTHGFTVTGTGGVTTSGTGATLTVDGSGVGGGSLVFLASATANDSAALDFTSYINSTYDVYVFVTGVATTDDENNLNIYTSTDGGSNWDNSNAYHFSQICSYKDGSYSVNSSNTNANSYEIGHAGASSLGVSSGSKIYSTIYLFEPSNSSVNTMFQHQAVFQNYSGICISFIGCGMRKTAGDVDAVRFTMASGNIASGTIRLYGITNS